MEISEKWLRVKKTIKEEAKKKPLFVEEEFSNICKSHEIDSLIEEKMIAELLSSLGIIFNKGYTKSKHLFFLNSDWISNGIYKILNSRKTKDGILSDNDLLYILNNERFHKESRKISPINYTSDDKVKLIEILEKIKILQKKPNNLSEESEVYILPTLLSKEAPNIIFDKTDILELKLSYDFLPRAIFLHFIFKLNEQGNFEKEKTWSQGVLLNDNRYDSNKLESLIKVDYIKSEVTFQIKGDPTIRANFLEEIYGTFKEINSENLQPRFIKKIQANLSLKNGGSLNYACVLKEKQNQKKTYIENGIEYNINKDIYRIKKNKFREKVFNLIKIAELEEAIGLLLETEVLDTNLKDEILVLSSNLERFNKRERLGLLSEFERNTPSKTSNALIKIIRQQEL